VGFGLAIVRSGVDDGDYSVETGTYAVAGL